MAQDYGDWSLEAIIRGLNDGGESRDRNNYMDSDAVNGDQGFLESFPEIFGVSNQELEDLHKPFYATHPLPSSTVLDFQERKNRNEEEKHGVNDHLSGDDHSSESSSSGYKRKYKKRKSHQKRVVVQVSADELTSDTWAWRKYGQKPIKGSPYPRSYYRCSSSKGCLARKQVEQSCTDPRKFIITYTAEHSHSKPTKRNSLAGTVRQKFPMTKRCSQQETNVLVHDVRREVKEERLENEVVDAKKEEYEEDMFMSELLFNDDFFSGLQEFDEFFRF